MRARSLASRIIAFSAFWVVASLVVVALLLRYFYRDHVEAHYDAHVDMHLEELIGASGFSADGVLDLAFLPSDPRYEVLYSGWYWEVRQQGKTLARSASLGEFRLSADGTMPVTEKQIIETQGPEGGLLRLHVLQATKAPGQSPLVYLASAPHNDFREDVLDYSGHIVSSFILLGIGLLGSVILQVRIALKPLNAIGSEITGIRNGKIQRLSSDHPSDVQPLVDELNHLLEHNRVLLNRARNQLGDLAHAVKNPLTVIYNETRNMPPGQKELVQKQARAITESIDHYLSRARTFGTEKVLGARSDVGAVVEDLVFTMQRLNRPGSLEYDTSKLDNCWFRGETQDLEEMLGNLIDNASKWADSRINISGTSKAGWLQLEVADDGPGIAASEVENVQRRGCKLDENMPGHGQGLGIVKDIAKLYGGSLTLSKSESGGLWAQLVLPAA